MFVLPSDRLYEREHKLSLLLDVASMLAREVEFDTLLRTMGSRIASAMCAERATVYLIDTATGELRSRVADLPEIPEIRLPPGRGVAGYVAETGEAVNISDATHDPRHFGDVDRATGFVTRSTLVAPIRDALRAIRGVVQVLNKIDGPFTSEDEAFLAVLATQVALALESTTLRPAVDSSRGVRLLGPFNHIVGASTAMRKVYELIQRAAATDATVLVRGPTGSGKGLVARAIHANCKRAERELVTIDCTTLPSALVESELFGHERGAFTGADRRVEGRIERASGGTLFLDEIGDLPLNAQAKLLRFLQERTFERVGGRTPLRADVRIVAATHRSLTDMVSNGTFREDLYFRLRVVEIAVPTLAARGEEEIVALARHFLDHFARKYERNDLVFAPGALEALSAHDWPGNVRELEHTIERAVVLCPTHEIAAEHLEIVAMPRSVRPAAVESEGGSMPRVDAKAFSVPTGLALAEVERRYVEHTLAACDGNVTRAADILGVGRSTLRRKRRGNEASGGG